MHRKKTRWPALLVALISSGPLLAAPRAATSAGVLEGVTEAGVDIFRGIPYAAAPTGENRWRAPRPFPRWQGVRRAASFGHSCWQAVSPAGFGPWTHEYVVQGDVSEDCLFLNVWAPAKRAAPRPVLVWIHGGGFNSGSGSIPIYDGRALAERGIVVVTINYRVGPFGFLAHPELTREAAGGPSANFGLQDMIAALRWVQANIATFGGDPRAVTIAGQSAGAMAVHELVASPLAKGLFARAVGQSGLPRPLVELGEAERQGIAFAAEKGASSLAALRALPAETLQASRGANAVRFTPVADGSLLPRGQWRPASDVPMLVGFNADEGSALGQNYGSADPAELRKLLQDSFGAMADRFAPLYPSATPAARSDANKLVRRDRGLGALYAWHARRATAAHTPVYAYLFDHVMPGVQSVRWGAFHSSEIPYVFRTLGAAPERRYAAADRQLSKQMSTYWLNFIRSGNPNGNGLPAWPVLADEDPQLLQISGRTGAQPFLPADKLDLMKTYISSGGGLGIF